MVVMVVLIPAYGQCLSAVLGSCSWHFQCAVFRPNVSPRLWEKLVLIMQLIRYLNKAQQSLKVYVHIACKLYPSAE